MKSAKEIKETIDQIDRMIQGQNTSMNTRCKRCGQDGGRDTVFLGDLWVFICVDCQNDWAETCMNGLPEYYEYRLAKALLDANMGGTDAQIEPDVTRLLRAEKAMRDAAKKWYEGEGDA